MRKTVRKLLVGTAAALAIGATGAVPVANAQAPNQEQQIKAVPTKEAIIQKKAKSLKNLKSGGDKTPFFKLPTTRQRAKSSFKQNKRRGL